jgi:hypothetical protein
MKDVFENILEELSKKLEAEDTDLLKLLIDAQRTGGGDAVKKKIKTLVQEIVGE